jgi:hypothetical protein
MIWQPRIREIYWKVSVITRSPSRVHCKVNFLILVIYVQYARDCKKYFWISPQGSNCDVKTWVLRREGNGGKLKEQKLKDKKLVFKISFKITSCCQPTKFSNFVKDKCHNYIRTSVTSHKDFVKSSSAFVIYKNNNIESELWIRYHFYD